MQRNDNGSAFIEYCFSLQRESIVTDSNVVFTVFEIGKLQEMKAAFLLSLFYRHRT
jgi:hypothetical protein